MKFQVKYDGLKNGVQLHVTGHKRPYLWVGQQSVSDNSVRFLTYLEEAPLLRLAKSVLIRNGYEIKKRKESS